MIKLWMLLRAMDLLVSIGNIKFMLMREKDGLLYEMTTHLKIKGVITKSMRYALWERVSLVSFAGYRSDDDYILIVLSSWLTQDDLSSIMTTIIQQDTNFRKDELWENM